jgi:F0F1-type ATP synthase assembly protein I
MRKRDEKKNRREMVKAFSMILQIGLAMMVCLGISIGAGYYLDKLFQTHWIVIVMMIIGIFASLRSMLILTGAYRPGQDKEDDSKEGETDESSKN